MQNEAQSRRELDMTAKIRAAFPERGEEKERRRDRKILGV
jgi:hypothetical protein